MIEVCNTDTEDVNNNVISINTDTKDDDNNDTKEVNHTEEVVDTYFSVDIKDFYDALIICKVIHSHAVVKINGNTMDVATSDGYRKFVKRMNIETEENLKVSFVIDVKKWIKILERLVPKFDLKSKKMLIKKEENRCQIFSTYHLSEEKYETNLAERECNNFQNYLHIESASEQRFQMFCRTDYDSLLNEPVSCDEWSVSTLKENISTLKIDQTTKTIYTSSKRSEMFAVGIDQLSIIKIEPINFSFNLEVSTAKAVVTTLSKFNCEKVKIYTEENGRYVTFLNENCTMALWVAGVANTRGDISKLELYTNPEVAYDDYKGILVSSTLKFAANAFQASMSDVGKIHISAEKQKIILQEEWSIDLNHSYKVEFIDFKQKDTSNSEFAGKVFKKTLKNMAFSCKEAFLRFSISTFNEYAIIKIDDIEIENGTLIVKRSHYTMCNTR